MSGSYTEAGYYVDDRESESPPGPRITYKAADTVQPSRPEWLWDRWLLLRALNLLAGRQGSGKSTFVAFIVALLSIGAPLPGDVGRPAIRVAWLSLEEPEDRVVARLEAAGADLQHVIILGDVEDVDDNGKAYRRRWRLPQDVSILAELVIGENIGLVVIDGLGYSISGDSHNYAVVGSALSALAGAAERTGAAIIGLVHPPKGSSDPVTAAIGSTAWTAIPRISMVLGVDPEDETGARRVVRVAKTNYREPDAGLSFKIGNDATWQCGFVMHTTSSTVTAEEITASTFTSEEKGERAETREVLRQLLANGPMDAKEAEAACETSRRTFMRARKDLHVVSIPRRTDDGKRIAGWLLALPEPGKPSVPGKGVTVPSLGSLGTLGTVATTRTNNCLCDQECQECQSQGVGQ